MNIENVPKVFQVRTNHEYPPHNTMIFEEYFLNYATVNEVNVERIYLPILWTNFYIERNYGNSEMSDLQVYLNSLDRSKTYFTVTQYDDGVLQNIDDLNILVFGAGGGGAKKVPRKNLGYPIPLICSPSPSINKDINRDIFCSFIGAFDRGRTRDKIKKLQELPGFVIKDRAKYGEFTDIMERSVFSLCPRGYGATSFRICESLQRGSIPVYIYDDPWIPWKDEFEFNEIGILVHEREVRIIPDILSYIDEGEINRYRTRGQEIYEDYFSFKGCAKQIIKKLWQQ